MAVTTQRTDQSTAQPEVNGGRRDDTANGDQHLSWIRKLGERPTTEQPAIARDDSEVLGRRSTAAAPTAVVGTAGRAGLRARASLLASTSLLVGVVAILAVLSGMLVAPGIALGVVATLLAFGGISASSRRSVVGRVDASLGVILGIAAIVLGVLSLTGNLSWLASGTNHVTMVHDWLQAHASWALLSGR